MTQRKVKKPNQSSKRPSNGISKKSTNIVNSNVGGKKEVEREQEKEFEDGQRDQRGEYINQLIDHLKSTAKSSNEGESKDVKKIKEWMLQFDEADYYKLSPDEMNLIRNATNPYGFTMEAEKKEEEHAVLNFSITQISHEYWRKFITTAYIGYLNRALDEWKVPKGMPVVTVDEYIKDQSKVDTPELVMKKGDFHTIYDYEQNRKWMHNRLIVKAFLEEHFQFNPDQHTKPGYRPNYFDSTRKIVQTDAGNTAIEFLKRVDPVFRDQAVLYESFLPPPPIVTPPPTVTQPSPSVQSINSTQVNSENNNTTIESLREEIAKLKQELASVKKENLELRKQHSLEPLTDMIPARDLFERFRVYYENHYEQMINAVRDLYCEQPDIDFMINPFSWHVAGSLTEANHLAEEFRKKHRDDVITDVYGVARGKWNVIAPYKKLRESTNFYNKDTILLEEIMKQSERDQKLGAEMTKHTAKLEKKVNNIVAGEDDPGFSKWKESNPILGDYKKLQKGETSGDCPDGAIEIPVWKVNPTTLSLTKDRVFTQSSKPEYVKEKQDAYFGAREKQAAEVEKANKESQQRST